jgi:hypothetical protein
MVNRPCIYPAVFLASKIIFNEASFVLYGMNCFGFGTDGSGWKLDCEKEAVIFDSFLDHIRLKNARLLHSFVVTFPFHTSHDFNPTRNTISILRLIRDRCFNIAKLHMVLKTDISSDALTTTRS